MGTYKLLERGPLMRVGNDNSIPSNRRLMDQQQRNFEATMAAYRRLHPNGFQESSSAIRLVFNKLCGNKFSVFSKLSKSYQAMPTKEDVERTIGPIQSNTDKESNKKEIDIGTLLANNLVRGILGMLPRNMYLSGEFSVQQLGTQFKNFPVSFFLSSAKTIIETEMISSINQHLNSFFNKENDGETNIRIQVFSALLTTTIFQPLKIYQANMSSGSNPVEAAKLTASKPLAGLSTSIRQAGIWWTTFSIAMEHDISQNNAIFLATAASTPDGAKSMKDAVIGTRTWRMFLLNLTRTQCVGLAGMVLSSYLASKTVNKLQSYNVEEILKSIERGTFDKNLAKYLDEPHKFKFD